MGNSWNIPSFDVYDPSLVLYTPLWRPDMVARGGSIKNGTGTMNVNPQALAVGANTITVTAAGTLIVAMPEGGTVASGTMTVTGSPVTVSAGIQTTITTTGAIGNITATPSNIIRSKNRGNLALTVTGATWGYQGRTFISAGNQKIVFSLSSAVPPPYTILMWAAIPELTSTQAFMDADAGLSALLFRVGASLRFNNGSEIIGNDIPDLGFHLFSVVVNGASSSVQLDLNAPVTGTLSNVSITDITLGKRLDGTDWYLDGTEGEASIFNRAFTTQERQQIYNATKWRYV